MRIKKSMLAAGVLLGAMGSSAFAAPLTISSTIKENGVVANLNGTTTTFTSGLGYDFTAQAFNTLTTIDDITVTLTIGDGDSDLGEFDENSLFLTLDGINTGLALNGFTGSSQIVTLTLTQLNPITGAAILAALADGFLVGGIFDLDADGVNTMNFPAAINTTLDITGQSTTNGGGGPGAVPLPAAVVLAPLGAGLAGFCARRFRRAGK